MLSLASHFNFMMAYEPTSSVPYMIYDASVRKYNLNFNALVIFCSGITSPATTGVPPSTVGLILLKNVLILLHAFLQTNGNLSTALALEAVVPECLFIPTVLVS
jgi:hypothetical protein